MPIFSPSDANYLDPNQSSGNPQLLFRLKKTVENYASYFKVIKDFPPPNSSNYLPD